MERNREVRRANIVGSNGFNRRRHRSNMLRDSPDDNGGLELPESVSLRDRTKKDRDRERERERERARERERDLRERERRSRTRRGIERLMEDDDMSSDESDDEEYPAGSRLLPPQLTASTSNHSHHSSSLSQQHSNNSVINSSHHLQYRKSFPPLPSSSSKISRASPVWKSGDEIISISVPRKARSSSTKRSHDWTSTSSNNNSGGGAAGGEQVLRQASSSPVGQGGVSTSTPSPAATMSPSSSNAPFRKKLKSGGSNGGLKLKPPKATVKQSSSNAEELEIEIAEVLYGLMTQSQGPTSNKEESREADRSNGDGKSHVSSPISNSNSPNNQISGPNPSPLQAVAPKLKRPRQVPENSSSVGAAKLDTDKTAKSEISSPKLEKISGSEGVNGSEMGDISASEGLQAAPTASASVKMDLELKGVAEELRESRDSAAKKDVNSLKLKEKKFAAARNEDSICMDSTLTATASAASTIIKVKAMVPNVETQRQQKLEIDLMASPPQVRSSPERETKIHLRPLVTAADHKLHLSIGDVELRSEVPKDKEDEKRKMAKEQSENAVVEESKSKWAVEEAELKKGIENKGRSIDVQLDLEKPDRNGNAGVNASGNKLQQQEMAFKANREDILSEKSSQSKSSLPLPVPIASWPGGLPPMGYMAPLQGVVSVEGSPVAPAPIQPLFSQSRPKRCATHSYIARSIHCLQQVMKMNPFWHAAAGSASLFGSKPGNLNLMPADLHGIMAGRGPNNAPDKGNDLASNLNHSGRDKGSQTANSSDSGQRKQHILIQQPLPPVAATNLLGPAFLFPLNQQQAAVAAASARPSSTKSPTVGSSAAAPDPSASAGASVSAAAAAGATATAMSFNYPAMAAANETQYLPFLQNNAYPFPIPSVGPPPNYRETPAQAMPMFNGSSYPSQMIHPLQLQHQQTPSSQSVQLQQAPSNASGSNSSSSSQKHLLSLQQRPQSSCGVGSANLQDFPGSKSQPSLQVQQSNNPPRPRQLDRELGSEGSPSSTDSKGSRASVNIYGQNFTMPVHPHNFNMMALPAALASAPPVSGTSNPSEKKPQQPLAPHGFAMLFGTINVANAAPGIDIASMAHNHAIFQSFPESTRHNIQMMAAATAQAAHKKSFRMSEDDKSGGVGESVISDAERKTSTAKAQGGAGQSIAVSRSDMANNAPTSSAQANSVSVVESSSRSQNVATGTARSSRPTTNMPNAHMQGQLQQQQIAAIAGNRGKAPGSSNGSIFTEHLNSSSIMAAKFPNGFPQNLVQSNSTSLSQSPQWRGSTRTLTSSQASSSLASSTVATMKNLPHQHSRSPAQMQTQISFGGNQKPSSSQGQATPSSNRAPSPPMMVGSPTTSSVSRGASGSPRTTASASTNTKMGQNSSISNQQQKNSPAIPNQKSPSILRQPHVTSSSSSGAKHSMQQQSQPQQQQQQQQPKTMQQAQLFFSNPYSQAQSPHPTSTSSTTSGPGGFYMQRRRPDQQQQPSQQPSVVPPTPSSGILTMCPSAMLTSMLTSSSTNTNDPAKAIAAATANVKGGGLPSQGTINAGTLLPASFSYPHPVPAVVQVKPAEQKQPAG